MSTQEHQTDKVARLLLTEGIVSAHDLVYRYGITRAAARIWDLKHMGWKIETLRGARLADGTQEQARYRLVSAPASVKPAIDQLGLFS